MVDQRWTLTYDTMATGVKNYGRESLLSLGNGFLGWRGALVTNDFSDDSYPGLYAAGVFNQTTTPVAGRQVVNEDLVNLPNLQRINIIIDEQPLRVNAETVKQLKQTLDFKTGTLTDSFRVQVDDNVLHYVDITTVKVIDPVNWHCLGLTLALKTSYEFNLTLKAEIDGQVLNQNVARYRQFDSQEFDVTATKPGLMLLSTKTTAVDIAIAAQSSLDVAAHKEVVVEATKLSDRYQLQLAPQQTVTLSRVMAVATSLETPGNLATFTTQTIEKQTFKQMQMSSQNYWQQFWHEKDVHIVGDDAIQRLVRMNIFHLNQMANPNANSHLDVSIGSRGLTGEGYRGHIFWDELFVLPYYSANEPTMASQLLNYRKRRLQAAEKNADFENEVGAMYPWQSGMYGDEQSQRIHLNTVDQTWIPDNSRLQRHVSLAIAYNMWVYQQISGKKDHLENDGLAMLLAIARFWVSKAEKVAGRYHISGVMGPNEFHEAMPKQSIGGLKNNAYTNLMVVWLLNYVHDLEQQDKTAFDLIAATVGYTKALQDKAVMMRHQMKLSISSEGIIEQYEGFFSLKSLDFQAYKTKYGDIHRIDRLLKAEGQSPDEFQVIKQADLLMLLYNFGARQTETLVTQLGYTLPSDWLAKNTAYYLARTTHGSTTSRPVFAGIYVALARQGQQVFEKQAYDFLTEAIGSDYYDIQGGTTAEGVHMGVMGETLAVIQNDYAGVDMLHDTFRVMPKLPSQWSSISFTQKYHGVTIDLQISHHHVIAKADKKISVIIAGEQMILQPDERKEVKYHG